MRSCFRLRDQRVAALFKTKSPLFPTLKPFPPSQESSKNGLPANYRTVNLFPLAFILYSFMEIECISLKEQLKALVVIYMKSCEVSLHADEWKSVKMIVGSSGQFPAITTLLTWIQQLEFPDVEATGSSAPSLQRAVFLTRLPHRSPPSILGSWNKLSRRVLVNS